VDNTLLYEDGVYRMDFADLERKIVSEKAKMLLLCSPHNPVGRVWTPGELSELGLICLEHGVLVVSDEIHCDFVHAPHRHHVLTEACPELGQSSLILTAPSKTFDLAGLQVSNAFIPNPEIRAKIKREMDRCGYSQLNAMGMAACQAAYESGGEWLGELMVYLRGNIDYCRRFIGASLPKIRLVEPEGTYLLWLDFGGTGLPHAEINSMVIEEAGLWLDEGTMFGAAGSGFQRMNVACPRSVLERAMEGLAEAFG
jgi:cystathionine beta-lyase